MKNYRVFEDFDLKFSPEVNILVGDNDVGKSTVLEAINLALTYRLNSRPFFTELSPHLFNQAAAARYVASLREGAPTVPPELIVDLFLDASDETASLRGSNNLVLEDAPGVRVRAFFNSKFSDEYKNFLATAAPITVVPTEYFAVEWVSFAGNPITGRSVPATPSLIDASSIRLQSGADYYLQQIITGQLTTTERVELARAYRSMREGFSANAAVEGINAKLAASQSEVTERALSLSIDISQKAAWERSLVPHVDDLPFQFIGDGSQHTLKVLLALNRDANDSHVILVEEPENHLSPASLNILIRKIAEKCEGKQLIVSTHSSYVLNKLGLDHLILLSADGGMRLTSLPPATLDYFKKLSGYDTLRLVLAKRVFLVEGPSDELLLQRAYRDQHAVLPMEHGIDVINVRGLSFKRFLDIARPLGKDVTVITDNDGRDPQVVAADYAAYVGDGLIKLHVGSLEGGKTLEPQLLFANGLERLNAIFGTAHQDGQTMLAYMQGNKTTCALKLFESPEAIAVPEYIASAVVR